MDKTKFDAIWARYKDQLHGDLTQLSDQEVSLLTKHYMADGMWQMSSKERVWVFMTELNARNSAKVARLGAILAGVALLVGAIQIFVAIKCK